MIVRNEKSLEALKLGERDIGSVYLGDRLIWQNNAEYITLPYIVSNGNSWSDTGLYLDPTIHRVQGSFIVDSLDMVSAGSIYPMEGARSNSTSGVKVNITIKKLSASTYQVRRDWGRKGSGDYDIATYEVGKEYFFDFTPEYTEINGVRIDIVPETVGACLSTYYIGYQNDTWDLWGNGYIPPAIRGTKRIFSIYTTGEIIGESIPVLNKSDNTFNYFDRVSEKYLENKGPEPWTAAYEAWVYQMGRPLSYLRADGKQWIDTKINPTSNYLKIKSTFSRDENDNIYMYGSEKAVFYYYNRGSFGTNSGELWIMGGSNGSRPYPNTQLPINTEITSTITWDNDKVIYEDNLEYIEPTTFNGTVNIISTSNIVLFDRNNPTSINKFIGYLGTTEIEVEKGNTITLLPFVTWEGVKGYLNLVNRELLLNQGTGEFEIPTIPVYAINWQDETFDPIAGKVAEIGKGTTDGLWWDDWTDAQKQIFRGKKLKVSWKLSAKDVVESDSSLVGFSTRIVYKDGVFLTVLLYTRLYTIFAGLESPYTLAEDYSMSTIVQIEDKEIDNIVERQPLFYLPKVQSGELKAYDIKWEIDVPEWEIDAIETLNASGIAAQADHQDNINMLNQIGII